MQTTDSALLWHDESRFEWRIQNNGSLWGPLFSALVVPVLANKGLSVLQRFLPTVATWAAALLAAGFGLWVLVCVGMQVFRSGRSQDNLRALIYWLSLIVVGCLLFLALDSNGPIASGFSSPQGAPEAFYLDNLMRVILLDVPEVWKWSLSGIEPQTWYAKLTVLGLRIFLALGLVELILQVIVSKFRGITFEGTVQDAYHRLDALPWGDFVLERVHEVRSESCPGSWSQVEYLERFQELAES